MLCAKIWYHLCAPLRATMARYWVARWCNKWCAIRCYWNTRKLYQKIAQNSLKTPIFHSNRGTIWHFSSKITDFEARKWIYSWMLNFKIMWDSGSMVLICEALSILIGLVRDRKSNLWAQCDIWILILIKTSSLLNLEGIQGNPLSFPLDFEGLLTLERVEIVSSGTTSFDEVKLLSVIVSDIAKHATELHTTKQKRGTEDNLAFL